MSAAGAAVANVEDRARLDFVLALRKSWANEMYPRLNDLVQNTGRSDVTAVVAEQDLYRWFAWTERNSQKMMWRAVVEAVRRSPTDIVPSPTNPLGSLHLDPDLEPPGYYSAQDIHLQPGGLWEGDEAALVYELGAKLVMLGNNDEYAFHDTFAATAVPDRPYRRIVDLGCGFGKSTRPFAVRWPQAEVIGIDLSAPNLRLAHAQAEVKGLPIQLLQRDAADTGLAPGSVDLVTATMLVHEVPPEAIAAILEEVARILAPGGELRILDFQLTGDPVRDMAMREHGIRNNEPFMPMLFDTDVLRLCGDAGLKDTQWVAFDERGAGRRPDLSWPERREWHFPWAVLEGTRTS